VGLKDEIQEVAIAMDQANAPAGVAPLAIRNIGIPDFNTARNGFVRIFSSAARTALTKVAATIHRNDALVSSVMDLGIFEARLRQCFADLHSEGRLSHSDDNALEISRREVRNWIKDDLDTLQTDFTHHLPAWTLGIEFVRPFAIGPVTFRGKFDWIDSVDFPQGAIERFLDAREFNQRWKEILKEALNPRSEDEPQGLATSLLSALKNCPSVLSVNVNGYEKQLSKKVADIVCKSGLDAVSLIFGGKDFFHKQALHSDSVVPVLTESILETNGYLWLPGSKMSLRMVSTDRNQMSQHLLKAAVAPLVASVGRILQALIDPSSSSHPDLAKRWSTALDWLADGTREKNDAVAVAKIGTSLDVLACGGKYSGIVDMMVNLTGMQATDAVTHGTAPKSLSDVVKIVYNEGRSQVLHGTHFDRLKSFQEHRAFAEHLAIAALIESAIRLDTYAGPDESFAFRTMQKRPVGQA